MRSFPFVLLGALTAVAPLSAQQAQFTRADTLRGTLTPERAWWDVHYYDLHVDVNPADSTIRGANTIAYRVVSPGSTLQFDLQPPLGVDSVVAADGDRLSHRRDGNAYFVDVGTTREVGGLHSVTVHYGGAPIVATNPPWDGGFIWSRDPVGNDWVATANQGLGASAWWPNKDHQSEEPDSMRIAVTVPAGMTNVSNGRLRDEIRHSDGRVTWVWFVTNPINNYNVTVNAGDYVHFGETYQGLDGTLDLDYWVLSGSLDAARRQFKQVLPMMACFEDWFGPYPFYEDGFKLVETPHLGMEHQSAVAYGNGFRNGYRGRDLSGTGWGLNWDFIIIHEAGHEWFGNNITTEDVADMWVHEGFTNYSENLFTECLYGKEAGADYVIGTRANIRNDRPIIGTYGVQSEGSGDMYYKGGNLLHTVRHLVDDDVLWKNILRGLNKDFRHSIVTSAQVEAYISERAGMDLSRVWDQYLRHTEIPTLLHYFEEGQLFFRWDAEVEWFDMPVRVTLDGRRYTWIQPTTEEWRSLSAPPGAEQAFAVDRNFYVQVERLAGQ